MKHNEKAKSASRAWDNNTYSSWENIKRLIIIQLIQCRSIFIVFLGFLFVFAQVFACCIADLHLSPKDYGVWDIYSGLEIQGMIIGVLYVLFVCSYNLLSKDEISMFPGTVLSRYYSTVLVYHIMILAFVLESVLLYFILGGLLLFFTNLWHELIPYSLLCWEYLWKGSILLLARCLAVYGFSVLWYALLERFRARIVYSVAAACFLCFILLARSGRAEAVFRVSSAFIGEGLSFGAYLLLLFASWATCLLLSWALAKTVHSWKRADKSRLAASFVILQVGILSGIIAHRTEYSYEYHYEVEKFQETTDHRASSLVDISGLQEEEREAALSSIDLCWKTPYQKENCMLLGSELCTVSEAKAYGLDFEESGIDDQHVMVLLGSQGLRYNGQDVGEELIKSCQDAITLQQHKGVTHDKEEYPEYGFYYQVTLPDHPVIVLNEAFGNIRKYLSDTTLDNEAWDNEITGRLLKVVIYPDTWELDLEEE